MVSNFRVWDKKKEKFIDNEEFVIDQNGNLIKLYYEGMGLHGFETLNKDDFEIKFNQPTEKKPEEKSMIVEENKVIECPSCKREWDLSKSNSCECGAIKIPIPKPKEHRIKFIQRGTSDEDR